ALLQYQHKRSGNQRRSRKRFGSPWPALSRAICCKVGRTSSADARGRLELRMLSHRYNSIFVHVRKNAGSSIIRSFLQDEPASDDIGYGTDGTLDATWVTGRYPTYLTFAVARNPWSRF